MAPTTIGSSTTTCKLSSDLTCTYTCGDIVYDLSPLKHPFEPGVQASDGEHDYYWKVCDPPKKACKQAGPNPVAIQTWGSGDTDCAEIGDSTKAACTVEEEGAPDKGIQCTPAWWNEWTRSHLPLGLRSGGRRPGGEGPLR